MHFRQRIAWLLLALFLASTCAFVYYIFEISDSFNNFALDHMHKYHSVKEISRDIDKAKAEAAVNAEESKTDDQWKFWLHITDIPLAGWILIAVPPYLQVFCMLLACTKPDPHYSTAFMWPLYLYIKVKQCLYGNNPPKHDLKPVNTPRENGHVLIST